MALKKIMVQLLRKNKQANQILNQIIIGKAIQNDVVHLNVRALTRTEVDKRPLRSEVINFFMSLTEAENYLEIGVRNPESNFVKIKSKNKYSVDPGIESIVNAADFPVTSDVFFELLEKNQFEKMKSDIRFDVIFIDGLHIASQVERDIQNSLNYIKDDGFIILHDCNPPSEYHQREDYQYTNSPAAGSWNGTTWKAFYKYRHIENLTSICFDTDWGVGVITKRQMPAFNTLGGKVKNEFYEYDVLEKNRKECLNLTSFHEWTQLVNKQTTAI